MSKKLFVGGLSYETNQQVLRDLFSQAGAVTSAVVIVDKISGRSKGFGFVEMLSDEDAQKAIDTFNGKELDGRKITVNEARPQEPRFDRGSFGRGGGGGRDFGGGGGYRRNNY